MSEQGKVAGKAPIMQNLEKGKTYAGAHVECLPISRGATALTKGQVSLLACSNQKKTEKPPCVHANNREMRLFAMDRIRHSD